MKQTSTTSRLISVRSLLPPPPLHYHLSTTNLAFALTLTCIDQEPLPSVKGCGLHQQPQPAQKRRQQPLSPLPSPEECGPLCRSRNLAPLPSPEGCGRCTFAQWRSQDDEGQADDEDDQDDDGDDQENDKDRDMEEEEEGDGEEGYTTKATRRRRTVIRTRRPAEECKPRDKESWNNNSPTEGL